MRGIKKLFDIHIQQRYVFAMMAFTGSIINIHCRTVLSIALPVMVTNSTNGTGTPYSTDKSEIYWSEETQGIILSSLQFGTIVTALPAGIIADRFGGKQVTGLSLVFAAVGTTLHPLAALAGQYWIIALRVLTGLGLALHFPGLNAIASKWVPAEERAVMGFFLYSGVEIGMVTSNLLAGGLLGLAPGNWPLVFYVNGGIVLVVLALWYIFCFNDPESNPFITDNEKQFLRDKITVKQNKTRPSPPWRSIVTSPPVYAMCSTYIAFIWSLSIISMDFPKYLHSTQNVSATTNGLMCALPFLCMFLASLVSGIVSDKLVKGNHLEMTATRKLFTVISLGGCALGFVGAALVAPNPYGVITFFSIGMGSLGCATACIRVNSLDLSPNFSATLTAFVAVIGSILAILAPTMVGFLAPNQTYEEYNVLFYISAAINLIALVIYFVFGSVKVQTWNDNSKDSRPKNSVQTNQIELSQ